MIIDDTTINQVGETAYATWKDAALADLANMLCMSQFDQSITNMTGVIHQDGQHIYLPSWYSEIWSINMIDGTPVNYKTSYDKSDGLSPETKYTNIITLNDTYPAGAKVSISGRSGFKRLPAPLANVLAAIIQADQSIADKTDSITSKKIEDVSVSYATSTQPTIEHALTPYKALLDTWKLCPVNPDTGGILSMPTPHQELPWWVNTQDYLGGDYTYGTAM